MELILQDEKGDRIHASIDKYTKKYFRDKIYDHDVVGHVVSYEPIQLSKQGDNNNSFMNIIVEDEKKNNLPTTLWDDLVFQMQSHLSGSTDEPLIVVLQLMKTHKFRASCEYEKVSQTSSQQHISISEELSTGMVSFKFIKDFLQLTETTKELKEGLIGDANIGYPIELDTLIEKKLMFKVQIKDSNINKNDNVYKVVKFIDDEALLKEYYPSLIHSLTEASLDCEQSIDEDKLIET
ncbi:hypothetical protein KY290_012934 [Solanum tuberosum]|uniref:Uncharacterized protein n=1 Tax=Solanum tuberosum TaxID=4113 RepID=A0ABQ7VKL1_SOLTU|nr:hypothetical protein KY285_012703 [Solanum tuberosum]KAH0768953.1 hypothetical protein KY290_012934 [Solanum tuberosum]